MSANRTVNVKSKSNPASKKSIVLDKFNLLTEIIRTALSTTEGDIANKDEVDKDAFEKARRVFDSSLIGTRLELEVLTSGDVSVEASMHEKLFDLVQQLIQKDVDAEMYFEPQVQKIFFENFIKGLLEAKEANKNDKSCFVEWIPSEGYLRQWKKGMNAAIQEEVDKIAKEGANKAASTAYRLDGPAPESERLTGQQLQIKNLLDKLLPVSVKQEAAAKSRIFKANSESKMDDSSNEKKNDKENDNNSNCCNIM